MCRNQSEEYFLLQVRRFFRAYEAKKENISLSQQQIRLMEEQARQQVQDEVARLVY